MKNTIMEVNTKKFFHNIQKIQEYVGSKVIMPVIKANAYGTYLNKRLDILNHFQIVAVAEVQEAIELRKIGYEKEIFVLNQPFSTELEEIEEYRITIGLCEEHFIDQVKNPVHVHLEIETGMNRTRIPLENLNPFIDKIKKNANIIVDGVYTHFSSADNDIDYTEKQMNVFQEAVEIVKKSFCISYVHCSASSGIIHCRETISNMVRPGLILYGYESYKGIKDIIDIEPITTLKTKISFIKEVGALEAISYNQKFITPYPMKIATIPIGYADGLRRDFIHKGEVVVKGEKRKILGTICMDSCMIDVTNLDVEVGDEVYIWDNDKITLDDISQELNTISYEILSTISDRVQREFIEE